MAHENEGNMVNEFDPGVDPRLEKLLLPGSGPMLPVMMTGRQLGMVVDMASQALLAAADELDPEGTAAERDTLAALWSLHQILLQQSESPGCRSNENPYG